MAQRWNRTHFPYRDSFDHHRYHTPTQSLTPSIPFEAFQCKMSHCHWLGSSLSYLLLPALGPGDCPKIKDFFQCHVPLDQVDCLFAVCSLLDLEVHRCKDAVYEY